MKEKRKRRTINNALPFLQCAAKSDYSEENIIGRFSCTPNRGGTGVTFPPSPCPNLWGVKKRLMEMWSTSLVLVFLVGEEFSFCSTKRLNSFIHRAIVTVMMERRGRTQTIETHLMVKAENIHARNISWRTGIVELLWNLLLCQACSTTTCLIYSSIDSLGASRCCVYALFCWMMDRENFPHHGWSRATLLCFTIISSLIPMHDWWSLTLSVWHLPQYSIQSCNKSRDF